MPSLKSAKAFQSSKRACTTASSDRKSLFSNARSACGGGVRSRLQPGLGTFFDELIDFRDENGEKFVSRIADVLSAHNPRKRARKVRDLETHLRRLRALLANVLWAHLYRQTGAVLYYAKADAEHYADKPSWMRHGALADVMVEMRNASLVNTLTGRKMGSNSEAPSYVSSFAASERLLSLARESGIGKGDIDRPVPDDDLVKLYAPKPKSEWDPIRGGLTEPRKSERIYFAHTEETAAWAKLISDLNAFYRAHKIDLALDARGCQRWVEALNRDPDRIGDQYRTPELFRTDVYRIFNNGDPKEPSFDEGGRLFGAWWMSVKSELRSAIAINGEPTIELDFANCHPRMLYHQIGREVEGDLYAIPKIEDRERSDDVAEGSYRGLVKWLMQVLINGGNRPDMAEIPKHIDHPDQFSVMEFFGFLEKYHEPISAFFRTGARLRLMRIESDIALEVLGRAMADGWVALSVHDSFLAPQSKKAALEQLMVEAYSKRLGMHPVIK